MTGWAQKSERNKLMTITANSPKALSPQALVTLLKLNKKPRATIVVTRDTSPEVTQYIVDKVLKKRKNPVRVLNLQNPLVQVTTEQLRRKLKTKGLK